MNIYRIEVEFAIKSAALEEDALDDLLDALAPWAVAVGTSEHGNACALLSADAPGMTGALAAANEVLDVAGIEVLRVEVAPQDLAESREAVAA